MQQAACSKLSNLYKKDINNNLLVVQAIGSTLENFPRRICVIVSLLRRATNSKILQERRLREFSIRAEQVIDSKIALEICV